MYGCISTKLRFLKLVISAQNKPTIDSWFMQVLSWWVGMIQFCPFWAPRFKLGVEVPFVDTTSVRTGHANLTEIWKCPMWMPFSGFKQLEACILRTNQCRKVTWVRRAVCYIHKWAMSDIFLIFGPFDWFVETIYHESFFIYTFVASFLEMSFQNLNKNKLTTINVRQRQTTRSSISILKISRGKGSLSTSSDPSADLY